MEFSSKLARYPLDFFNTKKPAPATVFFASRFCLPAKVYIDHSGSVIFGNVPIEDQKMLPEQNVRDLVSQSPRPFKVLIQFGHAAFVVANRGAFEGPLVYDPTLLLPIERYSKEEVCEFVSAIPLQSHHLGPGDTISKRLLDSIEVSWGSNKAKILGGHT